MFDLSGDDMTLCRSHLQQPANRRIISLSAAASENDLYGIGSTDQGGDLGSRLAKPRTNLAAKTMDARRVAVQIRIKRRHRFKDFRQYPGRCVIVEIDLGRHRYSSLNCCYQPTLPSRLTPRSF